MDKNIKYYKERHVDYGINQRPVGLLVTTYLQNAITQMESLQILSNFHYDFIILCIALLYYTRGTQITLVVCLAFIDFNMSHLD